MESSSVSVICPECVLPAIVSMHREDDRFIFDFSCPNGHDLDAAQIQHLWVTAHQ